MEPHYIIQMYNELILNNMNIDLVLSSTQLIPQ